MLWNINSLKLISRLPPDPQTVIHSYVDVVVQCQVSGVGMSYCGIFQIYLLPISLIKMKCTKLADLFLIVINVLELTLSSRQLPRVIRELLGRIRVRMSITQNKSIMLIIWPQLYPQH